MSSDQDENRMRRRAGGAGLSAQIKQLESDLRFIPKWLAQQRRTAAREAKAVRTKLRKLKRRHQCLI